MRRFAIVLTSLLVLLAGSGSSHGDTSRDALWHVVNSLCVPSAEGGGIAFPCQFVDREHGFAVLEAGDRHVLLVATSRLEGIESPDLLAADAPNYWESAWEARRYLDSATGTKLSRDDVALAINSARARTQDQLHIHIGCIRPDVRAALQVYEAHIRNTWSKLPFGVGGQRYRIMRVDGDSLEVTNPFKLLANGIPAARQDMASYTLVVAGATFRNGKNGFYILAGDKNVASGEGLLDYKCSVLLAKVSRR
jgi:CDP-diacylglycerol pyrophosphatase